MTLAEKKMISRVTGVSIDRVEHWHRVARVLTGVSGDPRDALIMMKKLNDSVIELYTDNIKKMESGVV